jgi:serpin B
MLVLLPKETDGLKSVENNLSLENLRILKGRMAPTKILVHIPKFEITSTFFLADTLASMGMVDAFSMKDANFRGIAVRPDQPLYLSSVIHKAFVEVSEEGTEASAATVADMAIESYLVKPPEPPPEFRADHPFIFLIQENQTGSILFMGRVSEPTTAKAANTR